MHLLLISLSMIQSILTTMVGNASTSDFAENNEKLRILNKFKLSGNRSFILDSSFHPHRASFHLLTTPPTLIFHFLTPLSLQQLYLIQSSYAFHSHSPFHPSLVPENRNNQVIVFVFKIEIYSRDVRFCYLCNFRSTNLGSVDGNIGNSIVVV